jgi:hypothetical protein
VKAAVFPVLVKAFKLSAARPPPVAGLKPTKSKFVGVARAARDTCETLASKRLPFLSTLNTSLEFM